MSGHSKWSTIKHQKGAQDTARGQLFTRLAAKITVVVGSGGGDTHPESNFKLRLAIEKAREANMPKSNIERAIQRGVHKDEGEGLTEAVYEGYAPLGVAVLVETVTDNRQRTTAQLKNLFATHGGTLGTRGGVGYLFKHRGEIAVAKTAAYDTLLAVSLEVAADDLEETGDKFLILTEPKKLHQIKSLIAGYGYQVLAAELIYKPLTTVSVSDAKAAQRVIGFLEALEHLADVHRVYSNIEIPTRNLP